MELNHVRSLHDFRDNPVFWKSSERVVFSVHLCCNGQPCVRMFITSFVTVKSRSFDYFTCLRIRSLGSLLCFSPSWKPLFLLIHTPICWMCWFSFICIVMDYCSVMFIIRFVMVELWSFDYLTYLISKYLPLINALSFPFITTGPSCGTPFYHPTLVVHHCEYYWSSLLISYYWSSTACLFCRKRSWIIYC